MPSANTDKHLPKWLTKCKDAATCGSEKSEFNFPIEGFDEGPLVLISLITA